MSTDVSAYPKTWEAASFGTTYSVSGFSRCRQLTGRRGLMVFSRLRGFVFGTISASSCSVREIWVWPCDPVKVFAPVKCSDSAPEPGLSDNTWYWNAKNCLQCAYSFGWTHRLFWSHCPLFLAAPSLSWNQIFNQYPARDFAQLLAAGGKPSASSSLLADPGSAQPQQSPGISVASCHQRMCGGAGDQWCGLDLI